MQQMVKAASELASGWLPFHEMAVETGISPTDCGQIAAAELSMSPPVQKRKYRQPVAILV